MAARRVHLHVASQTYREGVTACGLYFADRVATTKDPAEVTCAKCLREVALADTHGALPRSTSKESASA